jgi:hypothetical protein
VCEQKFAESKKKLHVLIQRLSIRIRGGIDEDPDKDWNPKVFEVVSSPYLRELKDICKTEPTALEVYNIALKLTPYDLSLKCGVQNMSISGHKETLDRIRDIHEFLNGPGPDEDDERGTEMLLKLREQAKHWNISTLFPDALIDELRRLNLTMKEVGDLPVPPGGWPRYRPEEVDEILRNFTAALALAPYSAEVHWRAALWTAFARGAVPLHTLWDPAETYALVPAALERAERLFRRAVALRPADIGANCMYGKFLEVRPARVAEKRPRRIPGASPQISVPCILAESAPFKRVKMAWMPSRPGPHGDEGVGEGAEPGPPGPSRGGEPPMTRRDRRKTRRPPCEKQTSPHRTPTARLWRRRRQGKARHACAGSLQMYRGPGGGDMPYKCTIVREHVFSSPSSASLERPGRCTGGTCRRPRSGTGRRWRRTRTTSPRSPSTPTSSATSPRTPSPTTASRSHPRRVPGISCRVPTVTSMSSSRPVPSPSRPRHAPVTSPSRQCLVRVSSTSHPRRVPFTSPLHSSRVLRHGAPPLGLKARAAEGPRSHGRARPLLSRSYGWAPPFAKSRLRTSPPSA